MKVIYIDESLIKELKSKINLEEYLKDNKLVIISRYPYLLDDHFYFKELLPIVDNDSIMYIALGNLANIINSEIKYLNYGPGFISSELINFPIKYYQNILNEKVTEISFCYRHQNIDGISKLFELMNNFNLNTNMKDIVDFKSLNIDINNKRKYNDNNKRKIIFISS